MVDDKAGTPSKFSKLAGWREQELSCSRWLSYVIACNFQEDLQKVSAFLKAARSLNSTPQSDFDVVSIAEREKAVDKIAERSRILRHEGMAAVSELSKPCVRNCVYEFQGI